MATGIPSSRVVTWHVIKLSNRITWLDVHKEYTSLRTKPVGSTGIQFRSYTFSSTQCVIDIDPNVFAVWACIPCCHQLITCSTLLYYVYMLHLPELPFKISRYNRAITVVYIHCQSITRYLATGVNRGLWQDESINGIKYCHYEVSGMTHSYPFDWISPYCTTLCCGYIRSVVPIACINGRGK